MLHPRGQRLFHCPGRPSRVGHITPGERRPDPAWWDALLPSRHAWPAARGRYGGVVSAFAHRTSPLAGAPPSPRCGALWTSGRLWTPLCRSSTSEACWPLDEARLRSTALPCARALARVGFAYMPRGLRALLTCVCRLPCTPVSRSTWVDPSCKQNCIPLRILQVEAPFKLAAEGDHTFGSSSGVLVVR